MPSETPPSNARDNYHGDRVKRAGFEPFVSDLNDYAPLSLPLVWVFVPRMVVGTGGGGQTGGCIFRERTWSIAGLNGTGDPVPLSLDLSDFRKCNRCLLIREGVDAEMHVLV